MQIDSTPLDVLILLDSGVTGKVDSSTSAWPTRPPGR